VTKPQAGNPERSIALIREELVPRIRALCGVPDTSRVEPARRVAKPSDGPVALASRQGPPPRVDVVAIGVSTGGPNALAALIPALPAGLPVPVVIVLHMPPTFTKLLAERLDAAAALHVVEGKDGDEIGPGGVWIAPGGHHMLVERRGFSTRIRTNEEPPENSCRPSVEPLFRSVAGVYGERVLAAVLTGMGNDGLRGAEQIRHGGGQVLAQDEATSVVWGMPGFVARAGIADAVLPLPAIAGAIIERVAVGRPAIATAGAVS
jgi:two-component system chemotaxis response regulator CheB